MKLSWAGSRNFKWRRSCLLLGICLMVLPFIGCSGGSSGSSDNGTEGPSAKTNYTIDYSFLMYRNYEGAVAGSYMGVVGITDNGGPIEETDIVEEVMKDSADNDVIAANNGFYSDTILIYDCTSGTCSQTGPINDTGIWGSFSTLPADTYSIQVEMENGQMLNASGDYPGQLILPYVSSTDMHSYWNAGDLELSWTNPTGEDNWDEVNQIRLVISDNNGQDVLFVRLLPTATTATIPAAVINQAATLNGGSTVSYWQIQTRAYDDDNMNFARGYSNLIALTMPTT